MFRGIIMPIVRRTRLYLTPHVLVPPSAAGTTTCGVKYSLVLLTMGIIMPETCCESIN